MEFIHHYFGWILCLLTIIFILLFKKITKNPNAVTSKYVEERKVKKSLKSQTLIDSIITAMEQAGFKDIRHVSDKLLFYANARVSLNSWTENIEIKIEEMEDFNVINFFSICAMPTQIFDWGKNKRNAKRFFKELDKLMIEK